MIYALIFALQLGQPPALGIEVGQFPTQEACQAAAEKAQLMMITEDGDAVPVDRPIAFLCHEERVS